MTIIAMHRKFFTVYQFVKVTNIVISDTSVTITYYNAQSTTLARADYTFHIMEQ